MTLAVASGPARAQAPSLPTPPPPSTTTVAPSSGSAATPSMTKVPKAVVAKKRRPKVPPTPPPPPAELFALNTRETFKIQPDRKGRITQKELHGWNRFLRCHHTGRVHSMSTRLAQLIYDVDKHFGFKRILVVAGYRAPRVAREKGNPKSPHKKGVACDFRVEGVPNTDLRDFERTLLHVGVGYYPNSEFVHLDVDPLRLKHNAFWIDYSRPGERARYSKDPEGDLQAEKTDIPPQDTDEDNELAPLPSQMVGGGTDPQIAGDKGVIAPNTAPALQPPPQNH